MNHLLLPQVDLEPGTLAEAHQLYLRDWLTSARNDAEQGDVAASVCLQGSFAELVTAGHLETDSAGIFDELLTDATGRPLAYSEAFGKRLYRFGQQWSQSTVHAIHTRWWLACVDGGADHSKYAALLEGKRKTGWIYDHDVSPTVERHRMKSELMQSMAEALEVLNAAGVLNPHRAEFESTLANFPQTGYVSAEFFRFKALATLGSTQHMPADTGDALARCAIDAGVCDFSLISKTDAYMGTAKRTARDKMLPSPLSTCEALELSEQLDAGDARSALEESARAYAVELKAEPMGIPAFQMRDVAIPFGADKTPIEAICASALIRRLGDAA